MDEKIKVAKELVSLAASLVTAGDIDGDMSIRASDEKKYTRKEIEDAIAGKDNATTRIIRDLAAGGVMELTKTQLESIRRLGIKPRKVGIGTKNINPDPNGQPVYIGNGHAVYTIEVVGRKPGR